ncbi:MAG: aspartate-semialdehyde dehydrogenase [Planctomycetota bacterium]
MTYRVAIVGATGAVGEELLGVFERRNFPISELRLLASPRSAGKKIHFGGLDHEVQALGADSFEGIDFAFFSAGGSTSLEWAPRAAAAGACVIDNSSAFRMQEGIPLVVPEVNGDAVQPGPGIIANPNCSTILMVVALAPLHRLSPIERVVVSSYQAASGAGRQALIELKEQSKVVLDGGVPSASKFPEPLAFNLFPHIDVFEEEDYTKEEMKMVRETRKILGVPKLPISATCVRVPVERSHSEAIWVETKRAITPEEAREAFANADGIEVIDDPANARYPTPRQSSGTDPVYVGRIRKDISHPKGLTFWICGDQLLKGAALNAVQIAEAVNLVKR